MDHSNNQNPVSLVARPGAGVPARSQYGVNAYGLERFDESDSDGGLVEYWRILRRNKRTILLTSLCGFIIGFAVGIPMTPRFRVKTSLEVLSINEDFMNMKQSNPNTTVDNSYDTSEEQTQAKLIQSKELISRVLAKLSPGAPPLTAKPKMADSGWRSWLHRPEPLHLTPRQAELKQAADSLTVRPTSRTRVLELTVDSTNPQLAVDFANTLTQEFMVQNMEARWATTQQTGQWLRRELNDARDKLRSSEDALQRYASGSGLIFTDESTNVATEKLQQVQQNLSAATAERITRQSRYELAQNAPPDSLGDVLSDASLRETQSKINDLKRQIADVSEVYSPEYTKVRRLQAELDELLPVAERQRTDILTRIKNDFTESSRRENLLLAAYNTQAREVTGQDEKAIQYNILKRDVDSNRQLYDTMLQQMKQASIASAMRASNVRVVDPATLPDSPVSPNFKLNAALGLLAGLVISIAAVTIRERADRTFQQPGDIKLWADITELGVIPSASIARSPSYYAPLVGSGELAEPSERALQTTPSSLVSWESPSLLAEAFRSTLTSVLFMAETANRPKVLVFTSASAADGKTTVCSNLAIAAAEIRMRVLVIDADLRRPRMHSVFDVPNDRGLVDLLRGDSIDADFDHMVQSTRVPNLSILPAGPATHSASHLLYSPMWGSLLEKFRSEYDMIFVDTPPMLQITDARVAGRLADAVVLVGRSSHTTRDALIAAKERLSEDHIRVLGAVLNNWDPKRSPGGYYGHYRNTYYSRSYNNVA